MGLALWILGGGLELLKQRNREMTQSVLLLVGKKKKKGGMEEVSFF